MLWLVSFLFVLRQEAMDFMMLPMVFSPIQILLYQISFALGRFITLRYSGPLSFIPSGRLDYTSHELRIGFQCKGWCKGPYTLTAVSDYNAWYNETLNSFFFFINATMIKTKWRMEPLCRGNPGFFKLLPVVMATAFFFFGIIMSL